MKRVAGVVLTALAVFLGYCSFAAAEQVMLDRIVAVVNDDIITLSELRKYKTLLYIGQDKKPVGREADLQLLNQLIEKKMIEQEGKKLGITVSEGEISEAIENIRQRNKVSEETMIEHLTQAKATMKDYRELLRLELMSSHVVGREVQSKITITDNDMETYYNDTIKPKEKPGARVRIQQILLAVPKDSPPEQKAGIEKTAAELLEKLAAGENFAQLAITYSQGPAAKMGGDLGYFHKGEMLAAIEDAAFAMEKEQVSPVIETPVGFHIIKVLDKDLSEEDRTWRDQSFEIKNKLYAGEFERSFKEWIGSIRKKSYIDIKF